MSEDKLVVFSAKVKPAVKEKIYQVQKDLGVTINEALDYIIAQADKPAPVTVNVFSDEDIKFLRDSMPGDTPDTLTPSENLRSLIEMYWMLEKQFGELLAKEPETITKEVEVIKQVPIALQKNQFVCTLPDDVATNLRKCRPFMLKDGRIEATTEPNDMVPMFANYYLNSKYDHVLNPLFR